MTIRIQTILSFSAVLAGWLLSILCLFIMLRVEWYNANAITSLPRPSHDGKWRLPAIIPIMERLEAEYRQTHGIPEAQELNAEQHAQIQTKIEEWFGGKRERYEREADFRAFVGSYGLLQYLLVPGTCALGAYLRFATHHKSHNGTLFIVVSMICGLFMLYRDYFGSLGW